jgi:hypothetical protein
MPLTNDLSERKRKVWSYLQQFVNKINSITWSKYLKQNERIICCNNSRIQTRRSGYISENNNLEVSRWRTINWTHTPQRPSQPRIMNCSLSVRSKEWKSGVATTPTCNSQSFPKSFYIFKCILKWRERERESSSRVYAMHVFWPHVGGFQNLQEQLDWARQLSLPSHKKSLNLKN